MRGKEWPEEDELVVATITKIFPHGAFVALDEYQGKEGLIHISEISPTWVKSIREFVKVGQKVVARVLQVRKDKNQIDLSLKSVKESQKRLKMEQWKREQKAEKLFQFIGKKIGKEEETEGLMDKLVKKFGGLYPALESIALEKGALSGLKISPKWQKELIKAAKKSIEPTIVSVAGYVKLFCPSSNGVEIIKEALLRAKKVVEERKMEALVQYIGAPRYRIKVSGADYKEAERALQSAAESAIAFVEKNNGQGEFLRKG